MRGIQPFGSHLVCRHTPYEVSAMVSLKVSRALRRLLCLRSNTNGGIHVMEYIWQYARLCIGHALNCIIPDVSRRGAATHHVRAAAGSPLATYWAYSWFGHIFMGKLFVNAFMVKLSGWLLNVAASSYAATTPHAASSYAGAPIMKPHVTSPIQFIVLDRVGT